MNKFKLITILTLLAVSMAAYAGPGGAGRGPGMRAGPGTLDRMVQHLARAADKLQISDEQMDKIFAVADASRGDYRQLDRQIRDNRKALRAVVESDPYDPQAVAELADIQGNLTTQLIVLNARVRADIRLLLTPEQRERIKQHRSQRRGKRHS